MTDFRTLQCDDYWFVTMVDTKKKFCYDQYSHAFFRVAVVVIYIVWICQAPLNGNNNIHPAFFFVRSSFATFDSRFPKCLHKIFDQLVELVKNEAINQRRNEKKNTHREVHICSPLLPIPEIASRVLLIQILCVHVIVKWWQNVCLDSLIKRLDAQYINRFA